MAQDEEINELKRQVEEIGERVEKLGKIETGEAKRKYEDVWEKSKEKYGIAFDKAKRAKENIHSYVKENPWNAVLIAAVTGFIAGVIITKNCR